MKLKKLAAALAAITMFASGCSFINQGQNSTESSTKQYQSLGGLDKNEYRKLAALNYKSGENVVVFVNKNNSTLKTKWTKNQIFYQNLDSLNRTSSSVTAYLDSKNLVQYSKRTRQTWRPTGWHGNRPGQEIYNRGHLIAYSLSNGINKFGKYTGKSNGDLDNPKNLFTQTAYTNQDVQTYYENQVREAMYSEQKVIYQATPIFRGTEKMARGINLQAVSTDGMLNFNVYIFNVQPGYSFDYQNGRAYVNNNMKVRFNQ